MSMVNVMLEIPKYMLEGLKSGKYERVGGVVRDVHTKQIVGWLREAEGLKATVINTLNILGPAASVLNLGLSTATLAVVYERTKMLEERLKEAQKTLDKVDMHIEIMFYATLRSALDMARNALQMEDPSNRRSAAMTAINQLIQAWNHYVPLADEHLKLKSQVADEYLLTLFIISVAEARCYLELGELASARQRMQEHASLLRPRVESYIKNLLTDNPVVYLHPLLKDNVDLRRLTRIYRWFDASQDESSVFDQLREPLFAFKMDDEKWINNLPPAIWQPGVDLPPRLDVIRIVFGTPATGTSLSERVAVRLQHALAEMETMIESYDRFEAYQAEIQFVQESQLTFQQWAQLKPVRTLPDNTDVVCIIPAKLEQKVPV